LKNCSFLIKICSFLIKICRFLIKIAHFPIKDTHFSIKNHHFYIKNPHFPIKNAHFPIKNAYFGTNMAWPSSYCCRKSYLRTQNRQFSQSNCSSPGKIKGNSYGKRGKNGGKMTVCKAKCEKNIQKIDGF
jgi:hypothetical protein